MARTLDVTDRERTAGRLLKASAKHSYDPGVDIDWEAPLVDGVFFVPEHRISLYGTGLYDRLSHEQRVELSKQEVASIASVGIWFETILMQMLVRHSYDRDPTRRHVQYAFTEIADECRHSVMFARLIERLGCPAYGVGPYEHQLGRLMKTASAGAHMFASTLIAEEILDALQREAMADESIQPLVRMVSRIHVVEEARHVRYAREELVRRMSNISAAERAVARLLTARAAYIVADRLIHPDVYAAVGIDPQQGRAAANANPYFRETRRWAAERLVTFLNEVGLMGGPGMWLWRRCGLVQ